MRGSFFILIIIIFSGCSTSKRSLVNELKLLKQEHSILINENKRLNQEREDLNKQVIALENALEESHSEITKINIDPKLEIPVVEIVSQLSELEAYFQQDASLYSKFVDFRSGGIEKPFKVSYSDMQRVITEAKTYIGTKHVMGGLSSNGIDCSGLLYVSFQASGITNVPRTAEDFARYGLVIINTNELQAGDLVFFTNTYRTSKLVTHAGICLGNGDFIHTSSSKGVMISRINDPYYWRKKFLFGTRIID